jgi:predicted ATP-grasp superfamily ATP-dependent carboligase
MDNHAPVVVVYRGNQGAIAIARTLGRLGVPAYFVAHQGMPTPVSRSRYWVARKRWDFARPEAQSLRFLLDLGRAIEARHGARPILLTVTDWVAIFIEKHADALAERFTFPRSPAPTVHRLASKASMHDLATQLGIPTPHTVAPQSRDHVEAYLESARFPIVMKSADPYAEYAPGSKVVHNPGELLEKYDRDADLGPPNLVLQEYVPGDAESVWMCNAYFGRDGECQAIFTGQKLRQLSSTGIATLAICRPNETVAEQTRSFMQGLGYRGCVGIGYRYDHRDGLYKVLDVNARVSGVFRLFAATNGMDVVRACYRDLTGQSGIRSHLSVGRKWLLEDDVFVGIAAMRNGSLTPRDWIRSLRGVREAQWFALDDPLPFLVWVAETGSRIASRRWAAFAARRGT